MGIFLTIFFAVIAAMLVSQLIGWLIFLCWWHEPVKKLKRWWRGEPRPMATRWEDYDA